MSRPPRGSQNSYPQQLGPVQQPIPFPSPNQGTADNKNINGVVYAIFEGYPDGMSQAAIKAGARRIPPQEPIQKCFRPTETITFSEEDVVPTVTPHTDALVVKAIIANKEVRRVHIDQGSAVDVMYFDCFSKLGLAFDWFWNRGGKTHGDSSFGCYYKNLPWGCHVLVPLLCD